MAGLALNLTSASSGNNAEVNADPVFPEHCRISVRSPGGRVPPHYSFLPIIPLIESSRLANDTAQGNGLGTLAACADRTVSTSPAPCLAATPAMSTISCIG